MEDQLVEGIVETEFPVRFAETDAMGVVHHAAYLVWLEEGRSSWMRALGSDYAQMVEEGLNLAVSAISVTFRQPARYGDRIRVLTWMKKARSRGLVVGYTVRRSRDQQVLLEGETRHICVNRSGAPVVLPDKWLNLFGRYQAGI